MASSKKANTVSSDGTRACLNFGDRSATPPHILKFRRAASREPGKSYSRFEDSENLRLKERVFGCTSDQGDVTAAALINMPRKTLMEDIKTTKNEQIYFTVRREPLGKSYLRNHTLPDGFSNGTKAFGVQSVSSTENAKDAIFPSINEETFEGEDIYKKSHGSYAPGEQKLRGYVFDKDMVFGVKGDTIAFNGVSKNVEDVLKSRGEEESCTNTKNVEERRLYGDILGQPRNLFQGSQERGYDFIYGCGSLNRKTKQNYGAAEVVRGRYSDRQQAPDIDLGKSLTPGFRNIQPEGRVFGVPSVRDDIPKKPIGTRSVADSQNYGDDASVGELVNPHAFANLAIDGTAFQQLRDRKFLFGLFRKIGYGIPDDIMERLFSSAAALSEPYGSGDYATIEHFRAVLNKYIIETSD